MTETGQIATGEERRKMAKGRGNAPRLTVLLEALRPQMEGFVGSLEEMAPGISDDLLSAIRRGATELQGEPFDPNNPTHRNLMVIAATAKTLQHPEELKNTIDLLGVIDNR